LSSAVASAWERRMPYVSILQVDGKGPSVFERARGETWASPQGIRGEECRFLGACKAAGSQSTANRIGSANWMRRLAVHGHACPQKVVALSEPVGCARLSATFNSRSYGQFSLQHSQLAVNQSL
jgi:hypothetical protein